MTRMGEREIGAVSVRLPDNPGVLACMRGNGISLSFTTIVTID